jgi:hypothetical protein
LLARSFVSQWRVRCDAGWWAFPAGYPQPASTSQSGRGHLSAGADMQSMAIVLEMPCAGFSGVVAQWDR